MIRTSPATIHEIRRLAERGTPSNAIARELRVSHVTVARLRKQWGLPSVHRGGGNLRAGLRPAPPAPPTRPIPHPDAARMLASQLIYLS